MYQYSDLRKAPYSSSTTDTAAGLASASFMNTYGTVEY